MQTHSGFLADRSHQVRNRIEMLRDALLGTVPEAASNQKDPVSASGLVNNVGDNHAEIERNLDRISHVLAEMEKALA